MNSKTALTNQHQTDHCEPHCRRIAYGEERDALGAENTLHWRQARAIHDAELNPNEQAQYKEMLKCFPKLSLNQKVGLAGEIKTVSYLTKKLRCMFPYPFRRPRIRYIPNLNTSLPDLDVKTGKTSFQIEIKFWEFDGPITGLHVMSKIVNKHWRNGAKRLFLSVLPKRLTETAIQRLAEASIIYVNGIKTLLATIQGLMEGSFSFNQLTVNIMNELDAVDVTCPSVLGNSHSDAVPSPVVRGSTSKHSLGNSRSSKPNRKWFYFSKGRIDWSTLRIFDGYAEVKRLLQSALSKVGDVSEDIPDGRGGLLGSLRYANGLTRFLSTIQKVIDSIRSPYGSMSYCNVTNLQSCAIINELYSLKCSFPTAQNN